MQARFGRSPLQSGGGLLPAGPLGRGRNLPGAGRQVSAAAAQGLRSPGSGLRPVRPLAGSRRRLPAGDSSLEPGNLEALYNLGVAEARLGEWKKAARAFSQICQHQPGDPEANYNLGLAYGHLGHWYESVRVLQQAIRSQPDYAEAHRQLGIVYGRLGNWHEGIEALREVTRHRAHDAEALRCLGAMYGQIGRWQEAATALQQALWIKPGDREALRAIGVAYGQLGLWREAAEAYQQAIRLQDGGKAPEGALKEGHGEARWEDMVQSLRQAVQYNPNLTEAHYLLGVASGHLGRWQEAAMAFSRALSLNLQNVPGPQGASPLSIPTGYYQETSEALIQALQLESELAALRLKPAWERSFLNTAPEQVDILRQSLQTNPRDTQALYQLGQAYTTLGRYHDAIRDL